MTPTRLVMYGEGMEDLNPTYITDDGELVRDYCSCMGEDHDYDCEQDEENL